MIIQTIKPLDDYFIAIQAKDGRSGIFDVRPYLTFEAFEPLKELENFKKVSNGGYYIEWACGADLSADTIEAHCMKDSDSNEKS